MSYIGNQPTSVAFLTDSFSGNGSTTAFTMSVAPANTASVLVAISGVLQDPSTYSVSGTTLTFSAAPPSGTANISARYLGIPASGVTTTAYRTKTEFTATAGQTTFTPPSYTAGFIDVFRNGVLLGSADYTASNGTTVVLTTGATAGDLITTESFYISSVLNAIPNTAGSVSNSNLAALSTLPVSGGTITLPQVTGTAMVSGNMPTFSAVLNSNQNVSASTWTKAQINNKQFDTANCYDNSTNYRFTPNVAGYYQVNYGVCFNSTANNPTLLITGLYKNGTRYAGGSISYTTYTTVTCGFSQVIYMNGSNDYLEVYGYCNGGSGTLFFQGNTTSLADTTYFQATLLRNG